MKAMDELATSAAASAISCEALAHLPHVEAGKLQRHVRFIESLAAEMHCSAQEIVPLYAEVLESLSAHARVTEYLPILVAKRVKRIFFR